MALSGLIAPWELPHLLASQLSLELDFGELDRDIVLSALIIEVAENRDGDREDANDESCDRFHVFEPFPLCVGR
jgi:hypothetical protein